MNLSRDPSACPRLDVHAVYIGATGPSPACPPGLHGKTEAVQLQPARAQSPDVREADSPAVIGGRPARVNADSAVTHTIIDVLPAAGVEVSLSYGGDPALARGIASTIRIRRAVHAAALAAPAAIRPAASQGVFRGAGFDACAAPSAGALRSWLASRYRAVGVYIGGVNRACAQSSLTASWIRTIRAEGWHYFPLYPGLQASCVLAFGDATISPSRAAAQGRAAARDAATQAQNLGIPKGTPIIYDMEAYSGCSAEVTTFLSSWDAELHVKGFQAGIYESFSNVGDLISAAGRITEPDVIHYADWDGQATTRSSYMPASMWVNHQRIHQYQGSHNETWGGVTLDIDNDQLDASLGRSAVLTRPSFRMAVGTNANGSAEWFARTAHGALAHAYEHTPASAGWEAAAAVGQSPAGIVSNPAVAANRSGRLTVFARDAAGQIVHAWHQPGDGWKWGGALSAASTPAGITGDPAAIRRPGGDVEVFVTGQGGAVATAREDKPNDNRGWTAWTSIGGSCASPSVPFVSASRRLEVFCRTAAGTVAVASWSGRAWGGWSGVGSSPAGLRGVPAVLSDGAGETEVFAATRSGGLDHAWQDSSTGAWTWGTALAGASSGTTIRYSPAAAAWPGGRVAVLAALADGQLGYILQRGSTAAAGWTSWTSIGGSVRGSPAGWLGRGSTPEAAVLDGSRRVAVASYSAGSWSGWSELGGGF